LFDTAKQRIDLAKLSAFFLTHPSRLPCLIQFTKRIARARETLATALVDIIQNL